MSPFAASLRREQPEIQQILRGIAALHVRGVAIDWQRFHAGRGNRFVTLPGYPWQRHQLWNESDAARDDRLGTPDEARLLGRRMAISPLMLVLALMLLRASTALVTGDIATLKALCGVRSAEEEAQEEADAGERLIKGEQS